MLNRKSSLPGSTTVEYAIAIAAIGLAAMGGLALLGLTISGGFSYIVNTIEMQTPTPAALASAGDAPQPAATPTPATTAAERALGEAEATPAASPGDRLRDAGLFLFDNFDDGDAVGWYPAAGNGWTVADNRYCANAAGAEHRSFAGEANWADYELSTRAELGQGDGFGLFFRVNNPDAPNGYLFEYAPGFGSGAFLFRRVSAGSPSWPLAVVRVTGNFAWRNTPQLVTVSAKGDTLTAFVNGQQVLQTIDDSFPGGQVGLRLAGGSAACFDDVTAKPLY
ncbi:MAG: hypothetical protein Kow0031_26990 [Anaerolineae bacterium]